MNYDFIGFLNDESVMVLRGGTKLEIMDELIDRAMAKVFDFDRSAEEYAKHYIWML